MFVKPTGSFFQPFASDLALDGEALKRATERRLAFLGTDFWKPTLEALTNLHNRAVVKSDEKTNGQAPSITMSDKSGAVRITNPNIPSQDSALRSLIETLHPWRKGPFLLNDIDIDSEWQSWMKWNRIAPHLPDLKYKKVADIGCNNGYYLFRLLALGASSAVGFDPNDRFLLQYSLLQILAQNPNIFFEPLGIEDLDLFPGTFDLILCLGVLYHRQNPIASLKQLKDSLRPQGTLFMESITIPEPVTGVLNTDRGNQLGNCLYVKDRYAKMRNVYFLPTPTTLVQWMERVGFKEVQIISESETSLDEQRSTKDARFASLADFLDPENVAQTVEGYPRPRRTIVKGVNV